LGQVHKRLTDDQVKELIERYLRKEIDKRRAQEKDRQEFVRLLQENGWKSLRHKKPRAYNSAQQGVSNEFARGYVYWIARFCCCYPPR